MALPILNPYPLNKNPLILRADGDLSDTFDASPSEVNVSGVRTLMLYIGYHDGESGQMQLKIEYSLFSQDHPTLESWFSGSAYNSGTPAAPVISDVYPEQLLIHFEAVDEGYVIYGPLVLSGVVERIRIAALDPTPPEEVASGGFIYGLINTL